MKMGRTVAGTIRSAMGDQRVAQMLDHFTQYVGSAPDASPAVLCGIAHMQTDEGGLRANTRIAASRIWLRFSLRISDTSPTGPFVRDLIAESQRCIGPWKRRAACGRRNIRRPS